MQALSRFASTLRRTGSEQSALSATRRSLSAFSGSFALISFGFWFGDDTFPEPAFYSYTSPEPPGLAEEPLAPGSARWVARDGSHLAVLRYDDARAEADPRAAVLAFYDSAYRAGAGRANWDMAGLACPGGVTDQHLGAPPA
ncbi:DUF5996 family protein [Streptomyces sp. Edi2]|uniref:DUF5996 family protein n=1 Tax=Streptomyces sp. Edi2 TaxID=3162528 RepID=UPI003306728F